MDESNAELGLGAYDDEAEDEDWLTDGEGPGHEWADQVRIGRPPDHAPELHRAMAAAAEGIEAVESRLTSLFERMEGRPREATARFGRLELVGRPVSVFGRSAGDSSQFRVNSHSSFEGRADEEIGELDDDAVVLHFDEDPEEFDDAIDVHPAPRGMDEDDELSDLDAALAAEAPEDL